MKDEYTIRTVKREDSKRIWEIRNHPSSLIYSNVQKPILFSRHERWFQNRYFANHDNICFVLEYTSRVIGYCRFDLEKNHYVVSIALDPEYRGKGLGTLLLSSAISQLKANRPIIAEVLADNPSSLALFEKNHFTLYQQTDGKFLLRYQPQHI